MYTVLQLAHNVFQVWEGDKIVLCTCSQKGKADFIAHALNYTQKVIKSAKEYAEHLRNIE